MLVDDQEELLRWLALLHVPKVGPVKFKQLLQQDAKLLNLPDEFKLNFVAAERDLRWQQKTAHAHIITLHDELYPSLLAQIANPPPILYVLGDPKYLSHVQLAMVGSRSASEFGIQLAHRFAQNFAQRGLVVTSGLAVGIDGASHLGALSVVDGVTIGVLAHGLDMVYPRLHVKLAAQVAERGCLVSEFPIGALAQRQNFPRRNRLISGLSAGVLVVEAAKGSGSLITALHALEQGREVFAVPGSLYRGNSSGCHSLIRQGAKLVETVEDVMEELGPLLNWVIRDTRAPDKVGVGIGLNKEQERLLQFVDYETTCIDEVVVRSGLSIGEVSVILLELELCGMITAAPGGYVRNLN